MKFKKLYESYHSEIKIQKRIITPQNFTYRHIISMLKKYLKPNQQILDIGCGAGTVDFFLASIGYNVLGVDISENALSMANINANLFRLENKVKFKLCKFPDESPRGKFDFIICSEVMEHLPDDRKALHSINKLLKRGGMVLITTPSSNSLLEKLGLMKEYNKKVGHLRMYSESDWKKLAENSGLKVIETKKNEGVLRKLLYLLSFGKYPIKVANRYPFVSDLLTLMDNFTLMLFGETHVFMVAKKL